MDALFPPGPQKHLLLGNAVAFRHDPLTAMIEAAQNYGEIVHFRFGPSHAYLVTSPDTIHYVLVERPDLFDAQPHFYRAIQSALGHELFAPGDGVYKRQQRASALPSDWLDAHSQTITDSVSDLPELWWADNRADVFQTLRESTLKTAANVVLGEAVTEALRQFASAVPNSAALQDRRFKSPWTLRLPHADKAFELALERVRQRRFRPSGAPDALSRLASASVPEDEIAAELIRLFHALHETAAVTLTWALVLLAQHPDSQDELHAEIDAALAGDEPAAAELPQLGYAGMVLHETMRLYPPAWLVCRQTRRETRIGSFFLPAGSTVLCCPYIMQRSPRYFVEPQRFLPERFSESFEKRQRHFSYAPFGTDSRLINDSLMREMKLMLATVARRASVTLSDNHPVGMIAAQSLVPKEGLPLLFHERAVPESA